MSNTHSSSYLKKIRVLTSLVKTLRGIYRIPNAPSRPADPAKQKAHDLRWNSTPTKATLHEVLAAPVFEENRRFGARPADRIDAALKDLKPKDSLKY